MQFKYHKGYKGYYLQENNKYVRPYRKLDLERTEALLGYTVSGQEELNIPTEQAIFLETSVVSVKTIKNKNKEQVSSRLNVLERELSKIISPLLLRYFLKFIEKNETNQFNVEPVLEILENVLYSDITFQRKARKTLFFRKNELEKLAARYYPFKKVDSSLKESIVTNYPQQYIYEHLPLDYKELEMVYVLYFITIIELLTTLK